MSDLNVESLKAFLSDEPRQARFVYKNENGDVLLFIDLSKLGKHSETKFISTEFYIPGISETITVRSIDSADESILFDFINKIIHEILISPRYTKFMEQKNTQLSSRDIYRDLDRKLERKFSYGEGGKRKRSRRKSKSKSKRTQRYSQRKNKSNKSKKSNKSNKSKKSKKYNRHY